MKIIITIVIIDSIIRAFKYYRNLAELKVAEEKRRLNREYYEELYTESEKRERKCRESKKRLESQIRSFKQAAGKSKRGPR